MDLMILIPLLVVLAGLIFVQRRQKQQAKAAVDEEKKGRGKRAAARSGSKKSAPAAVRQAAAVSSSEPEEVEVSEDWGWEAVPDVEVEEAANVSQEVDALTEYKVYKQFGYHEKAAESLSQYLTSGSVVVSDGMRSSLVNELVQLWLDAKKPDELAETLRQFGNLLTKAQTEDYITQGLAVLRCLACSSFCEHTKKSLLAFLFLASLYPVFTEKATKKNCRPAHCRRQ